MILLNKPMCRTAWCSPRLRKPSCLLARLFTLEFNDFPYRIEAQDGLVLTAFEETQLLTFGSDRRRLDFEAEWRRWAGEAQERR